MAAEAIRENLQRPNLSEPLGTCPVSNPTIGANEALINSNAECQRLALLSFFRTTRNQEEGQPIDHKIDNKAVLLKLDWLLNNNNNLSVSYNFNYSKNTNQTFDVATYGNSANGIEGPSKINVANLNLFSTLSATKLNEFHITYSREKRPRSAVDSNVPADTAMGFATTFRFGNPFFLGPNIDELIKRWQFKDNISIVRGNHTFKFGGEWLHTRNEQIFRGFFEGRYIFDSVTGFLRYASPGGRGRLRTQHRRLLRRQLRDLPDLLPRGHHHHRRPAALLPGQHRSATASRRTPPGRRTSRTTSSPSSPRTSGRSGPTSPSTTASAGTPSTCPRPSIRARPPTRT